MKRVKELKEEFGVTQEDLAFILGITQQRVSNLLAGKSRFYPEEIKKCANFFHVTTDYLMGLSDHREEVRYIDLISEANVSESQVRQLMLLFGALNEKQRKLILTLLEDMSEKNEILYERSERGKR